MKPLYLFLFLVLAITSNAQQTISGTVVDEKNNAVVGGAKYWKTDTKPMSEAISKSIELFANFKPETQFHPNWGLERAQEELKNCK